MQQNNIICLFVIVSLLTIIHAQFSTPLYAVVTNFDDNRTSQTVQINTDGSFSVIVDNFVIPDGTYIYSGISAYDKNSEIFYFSGLMSDSHHSIYAVDIKNKVLLNTISVAGQVTTLRWDSTNNIVLFEAVDDAGGDALLYSFSSKNTEITVVANLTEQFPIIIEFGDYAATSTVSNGIYYFIYSPVIPITYFNVAYFDVTNPTAVKQIKISSCDGIDIAQLRYDAELNTLVGLGLGQDTASLNYFIKIDPKTGQCTSQVLTAIPSDTVIVVSYSDDTHSLFFGGLSSILYEYSIDSNSIVNSINITAQYDITALEVA